MKNEYTKIGFTLAEILITLGIIGVVAAMTIPNLIATYKAKRYRSQFLKSYSTIQQVFKRMESDDISIDPATYKPLTYYKTFQQYLNGSTDCGHAALKRPKPCRTYRYNGSDDYKNFSNTNKFTAGYLDDGSLLLQDGSILYFENADNQTIFISVDLNGFTTPPNIAGHDLFTFQMIDGVIKPLGDKGTKFAASVDKYCSDTNKEVVNGMTCAYKALNDPTYFNKIVRNH